MHRLYTAITLITLLLLPGYAVAEPTTVPKHIAGTLSCRILPDSGINLLIHSTRQIRCKFVPAEEGPVEYYKGETGIKLGIDINLNKRANIAYSVLAIHFEPGTHQLAGKYAGAGGSLTVGATAGDTTPIQKQDKSISLQPIQTGHSGIGGAAGLTYLYLEPDKQP